MTELLPFMTQAEQASSRVLRMLCLGGGCLFAASLCSGADPTSTHQQDLTVDHLYEAFQHPPVESKPFIRWWWGGNILNRDELARELDVFKEAGLGGVEINPAGGGIPANTPGHKVYTWLSPDWCDLVKFTAEKARERGMITDLIGGTGWPYGGEFLKPNEQIQTVYTRYYPVTGGAVFRKTFRELADDAHVNDRKHKLVKERGEWKSFDAPDSTVRPEFATLIPADPRSLDDLRDVTDRFSPDGSLEVNVPAGRYVLAVGIWRQGQQVRKVGVSTPGGGGPVLDHFAQGPPAQYFERMSKALEASFGAPMGEFLRSMFVDSIELRKANWTADFEAEFNKRMGYDLRPWMPLVMSEDGGADTIEGVRLPQKLKDTLRRVCYDRNRVLCDLYTERFVVEFHRWCNKHGMKSRYQSYGAPWLLDLGNTSLIPDIPESNDWLSNRFNHGWGIWHKFTSSATHLTGKKIASSEAMTNTKKVYAMTLADIKQNTDIDFILGINHLVLHGSNYSPPSRPYPGAAMFGTFFSERNTWWPYLKHWSAYAARLSAVFQNTEPIAQFAVLSPTADTWSDFGLSRNVFHKAPPYLYHLVESIGQNGGAADYVTEEVLQQSTVENGKLCFGPMAYPVIVVAEVRTVAPETAEALLRFVDRGGQLILLGDVLRQSSGFKDAAKDDERVRLARRALQQKAQVKWLSPPSRDNTLAWVKTDLLPAVKMKLPLQFATVHPDLHQLQKRSGEREICFFANQSATETIETEVAFETSGKTPWVWNPLTTERSVFPFDKNKIQLALGPQESLLIVREPGAAKAPAAYKTLCLARTELKTLTGDWHCAFALIESDAFERTMPLSDLSQSDDPALATFAGTVVYRKEFDGAGVKHAVLDLGTVHGLSEVSVNGKKMGARWFGQARYDLGDAVRDGSNTLEVHVVTVALNYIKSMKHGPRGKVANQKPVPTGLVGPVRFLK